jgi:hypothetical protein
MGKGKGPVTVSQDDAYDEEPTNPSRTVTTVKARVKTARSSGMMTTVKVKMKSARSSR